MSITEIPMSSTPPLLKTKAFWESKTFWFNLAGGGLEIMQMLAGANLIPPGVATLVLAVGNIFLRRITTQPMEFVLDPKAVSK